MNKTLLSIVIGSAFTTVGYVSAAPDHKDMGHGNDSNTLQEQHKSMAGMDHGEMQEQHSSMAEMDHGKMQGTGVSAHGSEGNLAGEPGKDRDVSRIITVIADDTMRFFHEPLNVKKGETIKFVVTNNGTTTHEFTIATKDDQKKHGKMMMNNAAMHHGPGGNSITIQPNESMTLTWKFGHAEQIEAACNIPGHYQAGMYSSIDVSS
ncbi:plastocyanin/azurin family copper-binding protein [Moritella sp. Urea-trap-13]|uniref:cupredoxin domain-containing protein n=1 Tax=Moritella sp. Urea-trap-13 TaxID=2058327 RepID=UPI000C34ABB6|nr:plastocyanin/azurin family copper-binding protein [Moritella sp. Urea-trap-13]PKH06168.1 hypothetical protein CXF93_09560 [Moritella sp. Urea-trap-13]